MDDDVVDYGPWVVVASWQVSCYFQAQTQQSTLSNNICFNGPRAGINFNDMLGGGNLLQVGR